MRFRLKKHIKEHLIFPTNFVQSNIPIITEHRNEEINAPPLHPQSMCHTTVIYDDDQLYISKRCSPVQVSVSLFITFSISSMNRYLTLLYCLIYYISISM